MIFGSLHKNRTWINLGYSFSTTFELFSSIVPFCNGFFRSNKLLYSAVTILLQYCSLLLNRNNNRKRKKRELQSSIVGLNFLVAMYVESLLHLCFASELSNILLEYNTYHSRIAYHSYRNTTPRFSLCS